MLNLSIAGNVGKDAETRQTAGSSTVTSFSVAVSGYDFKAKAKMTTWVRVAVWGKRGEQLATMVTKGSRVAVSGELSLSEYQGKTTLELKAQDVTLLGQGGQQQSRTQGAAPAPAASAGDEFDDDIPF